MPPLNMHGALTMPTMSNKRGAEMTESTSTTLRGILDYANKFYPCPFCGNSTLSFIDILDDNATHYSVSCDDCEVTMFDVDILSLLRTWNRRISDEWV